MASSIGTWTVSQGAVDLCMSSLSQGVSALDAVTDGIAAIEADPTTGVFVVGCGGFPNCEGILQCDAAVMDGQGCRFGAVVAIEGVECPVRVARRVLEKSPPAMIVGEGATKFAQSEGFSIKDNRDLLGEAAFKRWQQWKGHSNPPKPEHMHDTLGVIARDRTGSLAAGVSTSGAPYKQPGRVGDSPLPGGGIYADNNIGAVVCTGDGDTLLRFCPAHQAISLMAHGATPQEACEQTTKDIALRIQMDSFELGIIAMDKQGKYGASGTVSTWTDPVTEKVYGGFPYALSMQDGQSQIQIASSVV